MGRSISMYGERIGAYRIWWGNLRERDHLEGLGICGRIIIKWVFKKQDVDVDVDGVDLSHSGQGKLATVVNAVMNISVP